MGHKCSHQAANGPFLGRDLRHREGVFSNYYLPAMEGFPCSSVSKESACSAGDWVGSLSWEDPLEKEMATHSSILAWKISWTEESGGLHSMGSQRVGHDWATNTNITRFFISLQSSNKCFLYLWIFILKSLKRGSISQIFITSFLLTTANCFNR